MSKQVTPFELNGMVNMAASSNDPDLSRLRQFYEASLEQFLAATTHVAMCLADFYSSPQRREVEVTGPADDWSGKILVGFKSDNPPADLVELFDRNDVDREGDWA